jgi:hypothetical protein
MLALVLANHIWIAGAVGIGSDEVSSTDDGDV